MDANVNNELTQLVASTKNCVKENKRKHLPPVYTVEDAVEEIGFGPFQIIVTVFAGMIWLSDSAEVMVLSILAPILKCEWDLNHWEQAMLASVVFVGFFFGGLTWGFMTDAVGRKTTLLIIECIIFTFGLISATAPAYGWLILFKFIAGFGNGGNSQAYVRLSPMVRLNLVQNNSYRVTYYVEFLPLRMRGVCIVLLQMWWGVGSVLAAVLALLVIPNVSETYNWRVYLCLCTIPDGVALTFFLFMPESARYHVSKGQTLKGEKVIRRIAWFNRKKPPMGRLVSQEEKERLEKEAELADEDPGHRPANGDHRETAIDQSTSVSKKPRVEEAPSASSLTRIMRCLKDFKIKSMAAFEKFRRDIQMLFRDKGWRTTVPLLIIWVGCAWLYYGAVLLTTSILENGDTPHCGNETDEEKCANLTSSFYVKVVWTSTAEFPGIIISLIVIELVGRKITMTMEFIGTGLSIGLLLICVPEGFATGAFQTVYVYTPEVYPTQYRGSAMGLMASAARIGALVTPFIAQSIYRVHDIVTISLYGGSCGVLAVLALLLPIETKGRSLKDVHG